MKLHKDFYIEVSFTDRIERKMVDGHEYQRKVDTYKAEYWRSGDVGRKVVVYNDESSTEALYTLLEALDIKR